MTDAAPRVSRRWLYIPFAVAGVLLLAYYAAWRVGADQMKRAVAEWVASERAAGLNVEHGAVSADGFPFFLRVHVDAPDIAEPDAWRWRTERLTLDALPYDLNRLVFSTRTEQIVSLAGAGEWRVAAEDFRVSLAGDTSRGWEFAATIAGLNAARAGDDMRAAIETLVFDLAPDARDPSALTLNLAGGGVSFAAGGKPVAMDAVRAMLTATQATAFSGAAPAAAWRDAGGALIVSALEAEAGASKLAATGALALDADFYPSGALNSAMIAPGGFVSALGDAGLIVREDADAIAAGLTLAAIAGGGRINAPIEMKNGEARIAGVALAQLPQID